MSHILIILSFFCSLDLLSARPTKEPTKFILDSIQNNVKNVTSSKLEDTKELLERIGDIIRIGRGRFVNLIILAKNIIINQAEQINNEFRNNFDLLITKFEKSQSRKSILSIPASQSTTPIVLFPEIEQRTYRLENETAQAILERRKPDTIRQILNSFLTPKPLVDRIKDEEKYGNTGKFDGIERAVVNGYENLSNFLNTLVDLPVGIAKQTSQGLTNILNKLGEQIIGL